MQRLILFRHATAERSAARGDMYRDLTAGGIEDARLMGRAMAGLGLRPDLALVSPAARTRQTWDAAHDAFGDVEVEIDPVLYNAGLSGLKRVVQGAGERCATLIVVGHNPGLHQLAIDLLIEGAPSPAGLEPFSGGFPTAAAAVFSINPAGRAAYLAFHRPEDFGGAGE